MVDLYNYQRRIKNAMTRLKGTCKETYSDVLDFVRYLKAKNCSNGRIYKYIYFLKTLRILSGKTFRKLTKKDVIEIVAKINDSERWKESTKAELRGTLKTYFKWLKQTEDYPEEVKWIKWNLKKNKQLPPEQILNRQEIEILASKPNNQRDRALILILYESGCRISELLNMKIKNIVFDQFGCYIMVSGKTGWRRVRIIDYSKELLKWLDIHPSKNNAESFVWVNLENLKDVIKPNAVNRMLKRLSKKTGIFKPIHPHSFRHARATFLSKHLPEAVMKKVFGWTNNSDMASVYYHLSGKDVDDAMLKLHGIKDAEKSEVMSPSGIKTCPKCGEVNSFLTHFCKKCSYALDLETILKADEQRKKLDELLSSFLAYYAEKDENFKKIFVQFTKEKKGEGLFLKDNDIKIRI